MQAFRGEVAFMRGDEIIQAHALGSDFHVLEIGCHDQLLPYIRPLRFASSYSAAREITDSSYLPEPILPSGKMARSAIHLNDSSNTSLVYGSKTSRSPGPQRRVSITS